jgi:uncharacterized protein
MRISVTVKPNSRLDKIEKTENGYNIHVRAAPIENKANIAVIKLLSKYFDIPKSRIAIISGLKSKRKIIEIKE